MLPASQTSLMKSCMHAPKQCCEIDRVISEFFYFVFGVPQDINFRLPIFCINRLLFINEISLDFLDKVLNISISQFLKVNPHNYFYFDIINSIFSPNACNQSVYIIHFGQRSLCIPSHVTHIIL